MANQHCFYIGYTLWPSIHEFSTPIHELNCMILFNFKCTWSKNIHKTCFIWLESDQWEILIYECRINFLYTVIKWSLMCKTHPSVHCLGLAFVLHGINDFLSIVSILLDWHGWDSVQIFSHIIETLCVHEDQCSESHNVLKGIKKILSMFFYIFAWSGYNFV
jgi:hypothetical protein